jgi:hypothetical protein
MDEIDAELQSRNVDFDLKDGATKKKETLK